MDEIQMQELLMNQQQIQTTKVEESKNRMNNTMMAFFGCLSMIVVAIMGWILVTINTMGSDIAVIKANSINNYELTTKSISDLKQQLIDMDKDMDQFRNFMLVHEANQRERVTK